MSRDLDILGSESEVAGGHGGGHGGGGHGHGGGGWRGGRRGGGWWAPSPWPWFDVVDIDDLNEDVDADALADAVAEKLAARQGESVVGSSLGIAKKDLAPFFLTSLPGDDEGLATLYRYYLAAFDNLVADVRSFWHPIDSGSAWAVLHGARASLAESWASGDRDRQVAALQLLAATMGYYNARFRQADGKPDWNALSGAVNAGIVSTTVQAAVDAGKMTRNAAQALLDGAKKAAEEGWGVVKTVAYVALGILGAAAVTFSAVYAYRASRG